MAVRRLDQIAVAPSVTNLTFLVGTQYSGGSSYTDYRFSISQLFSPYQEFIVKLTADSTTIQMAALVGATNLKIYDGAGARMINTSNPNIKTQTGTVTTLPAMTGGYTFDSASGTITFGATRITGELFILDFLNNT